MKARCVRLTDSRGNPVEHSAWAKIGNTYHVLAIWIEPERARLRLVGEEPTPALFEPEMFEIVSSLIPRNWVVESPKPGFLHIGHAAWQRAGFWEAYFAREPQALSSFESERAKSLAYDP